VARILVVEDEDEIRSIVVELLRDEEYDVVESASGDLASVLLQAAPGLDALVTDIHMPGRLDGLALARLFRERYPESPVLYVTGNPGALRDVPTRKNKNVVMAKPYHVSALIRTLSRLLVTEGQSGSAVSAERSLLTA
jgi:CheY-like chemotaxis protein